MYRVLLVDDEWLDLEGMEKLVPWGDLDMLVEAAVNNAFEALNVLEHTDIDILVTDIKMPNMSGLELTRKALALQPDLRVVFVSGHEDFHYAKQALSLKASNYVLKPVDDQELFNVMCEVKSALDADKHRKQLEQAYEQSMPVLHNEWLSQWLETGSINDSLSSILQQPQIRGGKGPFYAAILELDDISWKLKRHSDEERQLIIEQEQQRLIGLLKEERLEFICRLDRHRIAVVITGEEAEDKLDRIIAAMEQHSTLTVTVSLGNGKSSLSQIPESFQEARSILSYKIFLGKNRLIQQSDTQEPLLKEAKSLDDILDLLFTALSNYDLMRIDDCVSDLFVIIRHLEKKLTVCNFIVHIITRLDMYLATLNENLQSLLGIDLSNLEIIFDLETIDDIQNWLRKRLFEISEILDIKRMKRNTRLIEEIGQFIDERLGDNFTLRDVANHFAYSPNYLGHIFKEETGCNFNDYVIRKRLDKAKQLLADPKLRINEIAEKIGYKHLTYFSRIFKETFGITPSDYRKLL